MTPCIIDIYKGNVVSDWPTVAAQGIVGVIHKASEGASVRDALYAERREACRKLGLLWGAYHFNTRTSPIKDQVANFLAVAKPDASTLLCLDWEGTDKALTASEARDWLLRVIDATGRMPADIWIYGGNILRERINTDAELAFFGQFRLWHCQYETANPRISKAWKNFDLWQYSETGQLRGTGTLIDLNCAPGSVAELRQKWAPYYSGVAPVRPVVPPPVKQIDDKKHAPVKKSDDKTSKTPSLTERIKSWWWNH